jgi:hypothetical protein
MHDKENDISLPVIVKANGEREVFSREKLFRSLIRSGADEKSALRVLEKIEKTLTTGDTTRDIYRRAFLSLREQKNNMANAARYSVKRALFELGPSGYPFEHFVAQIFEEMGYTTKIGQMKNGMCVSHEIDIIAQKNDEILMGEAKYHNRAGITSDVKIPLYVYARLLDVEEKEKEEHTTSYFTKLIVTNTKFSSQAIHYGLCKKIRMISWDYPKEGNLRELIENHSVHPVSCLTTLSGAQKRFLLEKGVVRCKQMLLNSDLYSFLNLSSLEKEKVQSELKNLCGV